MKTVELSLARLVVACACAVPIGRNAHADPICTHTVPQPSDSESGDICIASANALAP